MNDQEMISCEDNDQQLERLRAIMHRLRAVGGCPWDAEQTHESLIPHLIEESYEVVDAIKSGDVAHLREELGDLLLQVVFHSEIAQEVGNFSFDDVAKEISNKLIRRHPHVFSDSEVKGTEGVLTQWDAIKRGEKGDEKKSYLYGVGKGLPALMRALKLQKKAAKVGFDWPDEKGVIDKIREEITEFEVEISADDQDRATEELGDILFSVVNLARYRKLDPELLMNEANKKFENRFTKMESSLADENRSLSDATLDQMEEHWQLAKRS
jgi:MazG family protein